MQRRVSSRGGLMVARQKIHAGMIHAGKTATVICENNCFRVVIDGETVAVVPPAPLPAKSTATKPTPPISAPRPGLPRKDSDPHARGATDATELTEMLQFLTGWLTRDPARLAASLEEFTGHPAYGLDELRAGLERFTFLLGGSDGEPLFGP